MADNLNVSTYVESRLSEFDRYKRGCVIAIYGSFYKENEEELCKLRDYLIKMGYTAKISRDVHDQKIDSDTNPDNKAILASEKLIEISDIHIFVMKGKTGDPTHISQSVSMEITRLDTLIECGQKNSCPVIVFYEKCFLKVCGGMFRGLLHKHANDWETEEFNEIESIFGNARQFCYRKIREVFRERTIQ